MIDNGISNNTAIKIKEHLEFIKKTANSNNNQPEVRKDFDTYYHKYRIDSKVQEAMVYSTLYKKQFNEIFEIFNIDSSPLLTLWGVETLFGRVIGDINILNTLYSLILMKNENKNYIDNFIAMAKLIDKHALSIDTKGSWAGAMGQCQFMPISFYNFAISLDKQKPDIIKDPIDALTSIANYLYNSGYDSSFGVLTEVSLPNHFNDCLIGFNTSKKIKEWKKLGIKSNEHNVGYEYFNNNNEHFATLIIPDFDNTLVDDNDKINAQQTKRAFLVYNNYKVLLAWNRSINFATTAGIMIEMLSKFSVKGSLN